MCFDTCRLYSCIPLFDGLFSAPIEEWSVRTEYETSAAYGWEDWTTLC